MRPEPRPLRDLGERFGELPAGRAEHHVAAPRPKRGLSDDGKLDRPDVACAVEVDRPRMRQAGGLEQAGRLELVVRRHQSAERVEDRDPLVLDQPDLPAARSPCRPGCAGRRDARAPRRRGRASRGSREGRTISALTPGGAARRASGSFRSRDVRPGRRAWQHIVRAVDQKNQRNPSFIQLATTRPTVAPLASRRLNRTGR